MRLSKKPTTEVKAEEPKEPRRNVSFSLEFGGKDDTLKSLGDAWARARCLGVPDHARALVHNGYMSHSFSVTFSWTESMQ